MFAFNLKDIQHMVVKVIVQNDQSFKGRFNVLVAEKSS